MVTERFASQPNQYCIDIASYNLSILPSYSSEYNNVDSWTFNYINTGECNCYASVNGNKCSTWLPVFVCDKDVEPYSIGPVVTGSIADCVYEVVINTTYACHQ